MNESAFVPGIVTLTKQKFCASVNLSSEMVKFSLSSEPELIDHIIVRMFVNEYRQRLDKEISFPLNWKEAVKERFAPSWFTRRWPVKYKTYSVNAFYPNFVPPSPGLGEVKLAFFPEPTEMLCGKVAT